MSLAKRRPYASLFFVALNNISQSSGERERRKIFSRARASAAAGSILRTRTGRRMDRAGASRALTRVAHAAGITRPISPHGLRRTFCTTGLVAGIGIRDMQYAMRHADPRTTMRYDMARANLDRHAAHAVAAYLAGMSTG